MIEKIPDLPENVLGFKAKDTITDEDYQTIIIPAVEGRFSKHQKVRLLYHIGDGVNNIEAAAAWDDTKLGLGHLLQWEKMAVVTEIEWIRAGLKMFGLLIPGHVKVFHNSEFQAAKEWICE